MKVIHVTPTYFGDGSVIGGGERYALELASWMARSVDTTLVSFGSKRLSYRQGDLGVELYPVRHFLGGVRVNPFNLSYLEAIFAADVIHFHQFSTLVADLGCLLGHTLGKRVFVTGHGGGGGHVLHRKLPILQNYRAAVAQSEFAVGAFPPVLRRKAVLIKGGIDTEKYCPDPALTVEKKILFVGRLVPHKGLNDLIEGFRLAALPGYRLTVVGRAYNDRFYNDVQRLAAGLAVEFIHDADDGQLLHHYRTARVTVLPSVYTDCYGNYSPMPELMGFTLLESQSCGTPAICTDAGAMHEFVEEGRTGFVVAQNSPEALATALKRIAALDASQLAQIQRHCRSWTAPLSWSVVTEQHLALYEEGR